MRVYPPAREAYRSARVVNSFGRRLTVEASEMVGEIGAFGRGVAETP